MSERSLTISAMLSTREKIITSAVALFIQQGIARTTTREIAASAEISEGSIYRHFPSKEQLAWEIFDGYHQSLADNLQQSLVPQAPVTQQVASLVECFLRMADENWLMFKYYITSQHTHMEKVENSVTTPYKVIMQLIQQLIDNNEIQHREVDIVCAMVMGAVHQLAINKIYGRIEGDLLAHEKIVTQIILSMLNIEASQA